MQEYLEVGQIVNTSGLKGLLKVVPFTDDITRFNKLKKVYIEKQGNLIEHNIEDVRYNKNLVLLKLKEIDNIEQAEKYKGYYLKIHRKDAVKLPSNMYFISDLIGLDVFTENEEYLGKVDDIFSTGSNDVYVVKNEQGKQVLLPAIESVIKNIDLENKKIKVNLLKGLI